MPTVAAISRKKRKVGVGKDGDDEDDHNSHPGGGRSGDSHGDHGNHGDHGAGQKSSKLPHAPPAQEDAATPALPAPRGFFALKPVAKKYYDHQYTQIFIAGLILTNFLANILEKQFDPWGNLHGDTFGVSEDFFNSIFTVELLWNLYANFFRDFICSSWNIFDSIVVTVGVLFLARVPLPKELTLLRCLRALRVFRLFKRIKSLSKILSSIASAIPGVVNAGAVVVIVISIYSILAVEFFFMFDQHPVVVGNKSEIECYYYNYQRPMVDGQLEKVPSVTPRGLCFSEEYYGTFFRAWYSLFQILTGDSWSEVLARPVLYGWDQFKSDPTPPDSNGDVYVHNGLSNFISGVYFMSFVVINSFVLINVVVAVLLDKMVSTQDEEDGEESEDLPTAAIAAAGSILPHLEEQRELGKKVDAMTKALQTLSKAMGVASVAAEG